MLCCSYMSFGSGKTSRIIRKYLDINQTYGTIVKIMNRIKAMIVSVENHFLTERGNQRLQVSFSSDGN